MTYTPFLMDGSAFDITSTRPRRAMFVVVTWRLNRRVQGAIRIYASSRRSGGNLDRCDNSHFARCNYAAPTQHVSANITECSAARPKPVRQPKLTAFAKQTLASEMEKLPILHAQFKDIQRRSEDEAQPHSAAASCVRSTRALRIPEIAIMNNRIAVPSSSRPPTA